MSEEHGHGHGHGHAHDHGHGHHHGVARPPANTGPAFAIAVGLNLAFVLIEAGVAVVHGSMALLADAGHNLSDVLSLLLAWGASVLAKRPPSQRFTYGLKSSSILAALGNAALLWVALGAILIETLRRFAEPEPVAGGMMMVVAIVGIAINGVSAMLFARGRKHDLNLRAAFQHLLADAAVSAGVVVAGGLILWTGRTWIDPVASLLITAVIAAGSWELLRDSVSHGLLAVPDGIALADVRAFLDGQDGVVAVHDLHVWPMSTTETALTAHLVMPAGHPGDAFLHRLTHDLHDRFGIGHATVQIEAGMADCHLEPDTVV